MRNSQLLVGLVFAASFGFALGSCSSSSTSSSKSDGSASSDSSTSDSSASSDSSISTGKGLTCFSGSTGSCSQAELDTYDNCLISQCGSQLAACYGSGYQTGSFSGPCASFGSCLSKCACTDSACKMACGQPSSDCKSCETPFTNCVFTSTCTVPPCLLSGTGAGGTSGGGTGGISGGGAGGFTGSLGGFTGATGTCADLLACCNAASTTFFKTSCMDAYNMYMSMGDAACGAALSGIKSTICP